MRRQGTAAAFGLRASNELVSSSSPLVERTERPAGAAAVAGVSQLCAHSSIGSRALALNLACNFSSPKKPRTHRHKMTILSLILSHRHLAPRLRRRAASALGRHPHPTCPGARGPPTSIAARGSSRAPTSPAGDVDGWSVLMSTPGCSRVVNWSPAGWQLAELAESRRACEALVFPERAHEAKLAHPLRDHGWRGQAATQRCASLRDGRVHGGHEGGPLHPGRGDRAGRLRHCVARHR